MRVQRYIESHIATEYKNVELNGNEFSQQELFPSINNFEKKNHEKERNLIKEANKMVHKKQEDLFAKPINEYFYQPALKEIHDPNKVWRNYLTSESVRFSVE